ncbi:MAG: hypothetical protein ACPGQS_00810 [Bradymonadia bacterium]
MRRTSKKRCSLVTLLCLPLWAFLGIAPIGCHADDEDTRGFRRPAEFPYETLADYDFFDGPLADFIAAPGVIPYQVTSPLWADHAGKARFLVLPEGTHVVPDGSEDWLYPIGTVIIKTFYFSQDLRRPNDTVRPIETRLLIKEGDDWKGHTYIWNADLSNATRKVSGSRLNLAFTNESGDEETQEYIVPNTNQCKDCHELNHVSRPLGFVSRQLDREVARENSTVSQLAWLNEQDVFEPALNPLETGHLVDPFGDAPLVERARSYLDANCAHCHRDGGNGGPSGLVLLASETRPRAYGVCKGPVAAGDGTGGHYNDILPGHPDQSIIVHRMKSTDPEIKMPEIPNRLPHEAGIELISDWILSMPEMSCD